jgi:hypothetical protein
MDDMMAELKKKAANKEAEDAKKAAEKKAEQDRLAEEASKNATSASGLGKAKVGGGGGIMSMNDNEQVWTPPICVLLYSVSLD